MTDDGLNVLKKQVMLTAVDYIAKGYEAKRSVTSILEGVDEIVGHSALEPFVKAQVFARLEAMVREREM